MKENPESHAYFERFRTLVDYENKTDLAKEQRRYSLNQNKQMQNPS